MNDPRASGKVALKKIKKTNGAVVQVSDNEILKCLEGYPRKRHL